MVPPVELSTSASVTFWLISAKQQNSWNCRKPYGRLDIKVTGSLRFAQSKLSGEKMITYFAKLPPLLLLLLLLLISFIEESSSFPLLVRGESVQDTEKNSVVLEDFQRSNQQIIEEEAVQNVDNLMNMINPITLSPLFGNGLGGELLAVEEGGQVGGENLMPPPKLSSDLPSFTMRPVTLGYWNWHWRRK